MKKPSFLNKLNRRHYLALWLIFHFGFLLFFLVTFAVTKGNLKIDADLFNMFPKPFEEESIRKADETLTDITAQNVFILVKDSDFERAKSKAAELYDSLSGSDNFKSVSLYSVTDGMEELTDFLYKYRFNLLPQSAIDAINSPGGDAEFAENAIYQAFSPFTMLPLDSLDRDPFMLQETEARYFLDAFSSSGIAMTNHDGVLAAEKNGFWYVMVRGILSQKGSALASKDNGIAQIQARCAELESENTRFIFSGTAFNSSESSNSAMKEISIISTVSMIIVILILLIVFRSPIPLFASVLSILISIGTAFIATLAIFHKIQILTLVFGTSLIGSCIDYSLHYFTHWAGNSELTEGDAIRNHLLPGLTMAIVSTAICFLILLFAPFNMLRQMALFSVIGLCSSYLTTIAIYPYIPLPKGERQLKFLNVVKESSNKNRRKIVGRIANTAIAAFALVSVAVCFQRITVKNDLSKLYQMKGRLLEDRKETVDIIKYNPSGWFIVRGESEEDVLLREKRICGKLDSLYGGKMGYVATSRYIPTVLQQKESREAVKKLLSLAPSQLEALGFDPSDADFIIDEFNAGEGDYISFANKNIPSFVSRSIQTAWLGEMDGKYYTVIMPNIIENSAELKELVKDESDVFFINKMADMGSDLDKLTKIVLEFFAIAYIIMFVVIKFFYNWKQSLKIVSVPILIVLVTGAIFGIAGIHLEFFSVTGLILVFGLGLDYIIYMMENEREKKSSSKKLDPFATLLSFVTTIISFGALALSAFKPVHLMGLSIFIGLCTAYITTMFYDRSL